VKGRKKWVNWEAENHTGERAEGEERRSFSMVKEVLYNTLAEMTKNGGVSEGVVEFRRKKGDSNWQDSGGRVIHEEGQD